MDIATIISKIFLPISLAIIMLGMGMTLVPKDFKRIFKYPKAILIGLTNQLILLPIIGFSLAILFDLNPILAVGLMILASCPGGPTSNLITQVCRGNIALSVTLTAFASFISILIIPLILSFSLQYFGTSSDSEPTIRLPIVDTILQIMVITVIPILLGMIIRNYKENFAKRMEKPMRIASTIIFALVFLAIVVANSNKIVSGMKAAGIVTLLLNIITMSLGFFTAKLFKLNKENAISISIESGIQNGTLALVIAASILNNPEMGIPIGAYAIWMFITGGILMWYFGRQAKKM